MSSSVNPINAGDFDAPKPITTRPDEPPPQTGKLGNITETLKSTLNSTAGAVNDAVHHGYEVVKGQYQTIQDHGVKGFRDDVVTYARQQPVKALLLAGGIGLLTALILRRGRGN